MPELSLPEKRARLDHLTNDVRDLDVLDYYRPILDILAAELTRQEREAEEKAKPRVCHYCFHSLESHIHGHGCAEYKCMCQLFNFTDSPITDGEAG